MRVQSRWWVLRVFLCAVGLHSPLASTAIAEVAVGGVIEVHIADDFEHQRAWEILLVRDAASGRAYRLEFPRGRHPVLGTGDRVWLTGELAGDVLTVRRWIVSPDPSSGMKSGQVAAKVSGALNSVVLIVNLSDSGVTCSPAEIASRMYGASASTDGLFREMSFGLVSFPSDTNQNGQPDVYGPFTVPWSKSTCEPFEWADAADAAAESAGVNLSLYGFKVYVVPSDTACTWGGLGYLGDENQITPTSCFGGDLQCRSWNAFCQATYIYAHELGHNVGMLHASTDFDNDGYVDVNSEYGDYSDVMGSGGLVHVNGPHKSEVAWSSSVAVSGSGIFSLAPLEAASTTLPRVLKIGNNLYYLSYRRPTGYDSVLGSPFSNATSIHRHEYLSNSSSPPWDLVSWRGLGNTLWVSSLDDGEVFEDPTNGVTIRQLSHSANEATVEVGLDAPSGNQFHTTTPCRWIDSRSTFITPWPLLSGEERIFRVQGRCGVPISARALAVNITITEPSAGGYLQHYPADLAGTSASTINFSAGQTRANNAILSLSPDGYQAVGIVAHMTSNAQVHVIIDIMGYFE